jgi:hypothetical protein
MSIDNTNMQEKLMNQGLKKIEEINLRIKMKTPINLTVLMMSQIRKKQER